MIDQSELKLNFLEYSFHSALAPFSFSIAHVLRTNTQVIWAHTKENISVFEYFDVNMSTKSKLTVNFLAFSSLKFRKIWQIGSIYFAIVRARFSGKFIRPVFCSHIKDEINLK